VNNKVGLLQSGSPPIDELGLRSLEIVLSGLEIELEETRNNSHIESFSPRLLIETSKIAA